MHPFHLSQAIYFGVIILFVIALFLFEKISKRSIPKTKIFVYSLTIVLLLCLCLSFYFYIRFDYSLIFPADYFQPHDYLFAGMALIVLMAKLSKKSLDDPELTKRDQSLISCGLILVSLIMIVPTSEKIADRYQYYKATDMLTVEENKINAAITHDVSSCRENPQYRKTYQIFDCETEGSRVYYMFAKNTTPETQRVVIHLSLLDQNDEEVKFLSSREVSLQPDEINKVIFDSDVFNQPSWMQHSIFSSEKFPAYQYEIESISNGES